jgi:hypothetical protein
MTLLAPQTRSAVGPSSERPRAFFARAASELARDTRGAIFVEFLVAFLPVFTFFLCLLQLGLLFAVRLVVEHAATNAARAAAVIIGDDPKRYGGEALNKVEKRNGNRRYGAIRDAVTLSVAPFILDGTIDSVDVDFPPADQPEARVSSRGPYTYTPMNMTTVSKVRVRVIVSANCKIGLANFFTCMSWLEQQAYNRGVPFPPGYYPKKTITAEGMYPYQGASYAYPPS